MAWTSRGLVAGAALALAGAANATVMLDFEGVGNNAAIGNFYAGQGVTFGPNALGLVDADAGGSGNFANEPSGDTIMFFTAGSAVLNYAAGFNTGFSFYYTSSTAATVKVYDGLNGTGNLLATLNLAANYQNGGCSGDPGGGFCHFDAVGAAFAGIARSVDFGGVANQVGFDNVTFGSVVPGVPEPETYALMLAGLGLLLSQRRRGTA